MNNTFTLEKSTVKTFSFSLLQTKKLFSSVQSCFTLQTRIKTIKCPSVFTSTLVLGINHCMKIVQTRISFWSAFSCIRTEYGDSRSKSPYSVGIQENTGQKNSVFGHFSCSEHLANLNYSISTHSNHYSNDTLCYWGSYY